MRILKDDERWFEVPSDPDNARVKIKHLSPGELAEINDKSFKKEMSYKAGRGKKDKDGKKFSPDVNIDIKEDPEFFREAPIKKAVVAWENFYDKKDKPMECTPENVEKAIRQIDGFVLFVDNCRDKLSKDIDQEKKEQLKNSKGSASEPVK